MGGPAEPLNQLQKNQRKGQMTRQTFAAALKQDGTTRAVTSKLRTCMDMGFPTGGILTSVHRPGPLSIVGTTATGPVTVATAAVATTSAAVPPLPAAVQAFGSSLLAATSSALQAAGLLPPPQTTMTMTAAAVAVPAAGTTTPAAPVIGSQPPADSNWIMDHYLGNVVLPPVPAAVGPSRNDPMPSVITTHTSVPWLSTHHTADFLMAGAKPVLTPSRPGTAHAHTHAATTLPATVGAQTAPLTVSAAGAPSELTPSVTPLPTVSTSSPTIVPRPSTPSSAVFASQFSFTRQNPIGPLAVDAQQLVFANRHEARQAGDTDALRRPLPFTDKAVHPSQ